MNVTDYRGTSFKEDDVLLVSVGKNLSVSFRNFAGLSCYNARHPLFFFCVVIYLHFLNTLALWLTVPWRLPVIVLPVFVFKPEWRRMISTSLLLPPLR